MFLHLGNETVIQSDNIIGIFDLDTSTVSKHTRNYLAKAQKAGEVINVSSELPKAFIVCKKDTGEKTIYICQISSQTLFRRMLSRKDASL